MKGSECSVSAFECSIRTAVSGFRFHVPGHSSGIRVPNSGLHVSDCRHQDFRFRVSFSGLGFKVAGFGFLAWVPLRASVAHRNFGSRSQVSDFKFRVSDFGSQVPDLKVRTSSFGSQVPDFRFQVSRFRFEASGLRFRISGFGSQVLI